MVEENVGNPKRLSGISFMFKTQDYGYGSTIVRTLKLPEYQIHSGVVIPSNIHYISGTKLRALITGDLSIHRNLRFEDLLAKSSELPYFTNHKMLWS
jgi:hypothetical protein